MIHLTKFKTIILFLTLIWAFNLKAQDTARLYLFSGIGLINGQGVFGKSVQPSLGFNSGLELKLKGNLFSQFSIDFNSLKYNQLNIDANSPYLFQNTNSTLLMVGLNMGYNFNIHNTKWSGFAYIGSGYLNIGEPRVKLEKENTIVQSVITQASIFGRGGFRIGYKTNSAFFQTLYLDTTYWTSSTCVQGGKVSGISIFIGTRLTI
jgi:hypothetical protein